MLSKAHKKILKHLSAEESSIAEVWSADFRYYKSTLASVVIYCLFENPNKETSLKVIGKMSSFNFKLSCFFFFIFLFFILFFYYFFIYFLFYLIYLFIYFLFI